MAKGLGKWYVEIEKQAYWRGNQKTWVNRYVMSGADPSSGDANAVIYALAFIEGQLYPATGSGTGVGFVEGRAYASTGGPPFEIVNYNSSKAISTATGFAGGGTTPPMVWAPTLETCLLVATPVIGLTSSGKPIHLRKYFRGLNQGNYEDNQPNELPASLLTSIDTLVQPWFTGLGSTGYTVQPVSALRVAAGPPKAQPFLANHQVPRGRKRKKVVTGSPSASGGVTSFLVDAGKDVLQVAIKELGSGA